MIQLAKRIVRFVKDKSRPVKNHIGISGGKDSTALLLWAVYESGYDPATLDVTFCDIGNDHEWTLDHVRMCSEKIHPVTWLEPKRDFWKLAEWKGRFPSPCARFCTYHLKIVPTEKHVGRLVSEGNHVVNHVGIRAMESEERSLMGEWDFDGNLLVKTRRPLIRWTIDDVLAIHKRHGIPLNPLYQAGAERVGCWPCLFSKKREIRNIALKFPERIDQIEAEEDKLGSTFFTPKKVPDRFRSKSVVTKDGSAVKVATIRDVVKWSMTGNRTKGSWEDDKIEDHPCQSGFCE